MSSISLFNYADQNPGTTAKKQVEELTASQKTSMVVGIFILAMGILFVTLIVCKYKYTFHKPVPLIHGFTIGMPFALSVISSVAAIGYTYTLHRKRPIQELQKQFP